MALPRKPKRKKASRGKPRAEATFEKSPRKKAAPSKKSAPPKPRPKAKVAKPKPKAKVAKPKSRAKVAKPKPKAGSKKRKGSLLERETRRKTAADKLAIRALRVIEEGQSQAAMGIRNATRRAIQKAQALLSEAEKEDRKEQVRVKRIKEKIKKWSPKALPSRACVTLFEELGEWTQRANKTVDASARWPIPMSAQREWDELDGWLLDWEERYRWLFGEPLWWQVGYQISDVPLRDSDRYDRIGGQTSLTSHWWKGDLAMLLFSWREAVALNVIRKGYAITGFVLFAHFGPTAPVGD